MSLIEDREVGMDRKVEVLPGPRVGAGVPKLEADEADIGNDGASLYIESEDGHDIKYKTLTWKKVVV